TLVLIHNSQTLMIRPTRATPLITRVRFFFFFNDTATTEIYTLSLHDALPIFIWCIRESLEEIQTSTWMPALVRRSEEHTSELQSHSDLVCRLLLEKKNNEAQRRRGRSRGGEVVSSVRAPLRAPGRHTASHRRGRSRGVLFPKRLFYSFFKETGPHGIFPSSPNAPPSD